MDRIFRIRDPTVSSGVNHALQDFIYVSVHKLEDTGFLTLELPKTTSHN